MSEQLLVRGARVFTPMGVLENAWLVTDGAQIAAVGQDEPPTHENVQVIEATGLNLLPGMIDVHVHGGGGAEAMDATPEALQTMSKFYAAHGVTSYLPTTWTDTRDRIDAALKAIAAAVGQQPEGATILGAHLEGPYLNAAKGGAQNNSYIRRADPDEMNDWLDLNVLKLAAVAPEYPENRKFIEACVSRGVVVSAAHTAATFDEIRAAVAIGLRQTTHTYNAMSGLHHREPGTLGAAMLLDELKCELIADNIHVHPVAMAILAKAKGYHGIILISDSVRGAGMPEGEYQIDERTIMIKDGAVRLPDGTLAGSVLTMDRALRNFMDATGWTLEHSWPSTSLNAARALGIDARKGSLEMAKDADFILVDDQIGVHLTVAEGRIVYRSGI